MEKQGMSVYRLLGVEAGCLESAPISVEVRRTGIWQSAQAEVGARRYIDVVLTNESASETLPSFDGWCQSQQIEYGRLLFRRDQIGLLAMDMDSTLITIECIDEIADFIGKKDQVSRITEASMQGNLDFSESLTQRVALLAGLPEKTLEAVYAQRLVLSHGAQELIEAFKAVGCYTLLVSGGFTFFTDRLKALLDLDEAHANVLEIVEGCLTGRVVGNILDGSAKAAHVKRVRGQVVASQRDQKVMTVGDGSNDRLMFVDADAGIAYHAKPVLEAVATHCIRYGGLDTVLAFFE